MTDVVRADDPLDLSLSESERDNHRDHIAAFVRDQADSAGVSNVVIALSGGIDSTLTAHLAVQALGPECVYGLVLPSTVNRQENMNDAERVAEDLGIEYDVVTIESITESVMNAAPGVDESDLADQSEDRQSKEGQSEELQAVVGNARARIRGVLSYVEANRRGAIVLGTGNRSENLVGYFTKYGDGAVDCHPLGNLYKGQVRGLAHHLGIAPVLVEKQSSAELWAGQTDEAELGMDYPTLDSVLAVCVDGPLSVSGTARLVGVDADTVEDVIGMVESSEHKRRVPPSPDPLDRSSDITR